MNDGRESTEERANPRLDAAVRKWVRDFAVNEKASFVAFLVSATSGLGLALMVPWTRALGLEARVVLSTPTVGIAVLFLSVTFLLLCAVALLGPGLIYNQLSGRILDLSPELSLLWAGLPVAFVVVAWGAVWWWQISGSSTFVWIPVAVALSSFVIGAIAQSKKNTVGDRFLPFAKIGFAHFISSSFLVLLLGLYRETLELANDLKGFGALVVCASIVCFGNLLTIIGAPSSAKSVTVALMVVMGLFFAVFFSTDQPLVRVSGWVHQLVGTRRGPSLVVLSKEDCLTVSSLASYEIPDLNCSPLRVDILFQGDGVTVIDADFLEKPVTLRKRIDFTSAIP